MQPVLVCNVGWMKEYRGPTQADPVPEGGGARWVEKHECFNFKPYKGRLYGYVEALGSIAIQKLGAPRNADCADNVTVFWVARDPRQKKTVVVGWYTNATVYRKVKHVDPASDVAKERTATRKDRAGKDETWACNDYYIVTVEENGLLLPEPERKYEVLRGKGHLGQRNIHYPKGPEALDLLKLIEQPPTHPTPGAGAPKQFDAGKRREVEDAAMRTAEAWWTSRGFQCHDVSDKNRGWDLEACRDGPTPLHIEVKGLSGSNIAVELTPHEYEPVKRQDTDYRLCVVTNAKDKDTAAVHTFHIEEGDVLVDQHGHKLAIKERIGAGLATL
ncbi:MAG: DUF3883 domain-containing protein [Chloroflexi bacterium]|nr:DUF3883 domain-containing protein [Chloroflexota bacterium]